MQLDRREIELITQVLAMYTEIAGIVDQRLRDEVVFLRNKLQEMQDKMVYEGYGMMICDPSSDRPIELRRGYVVTAVL